ncbi:MAG: DUF333 domain-containing protein [Candidatus Aenigmatarchaeota archaeon]
MIEKNVRYLAIAFTAILVFSIFSSIARAEMKRGIAISEIIKGEVEKEIRQREEGIKAINTSEVGIVGERERIRASIEEEIRAREMIRIEVVPSEVAISRENTMKESCKNLCGDGICQRFVCLAIGCPCPETEETCPDDCSLPKEEIANPAAVFCKRYGYEYRIEKTNKGEIGYCLMPNGEACEEWEFYRGNCGNRYKNAVSIEVGDEDENIDLDPEEGVEIKSKRVDIVGATPIFTARIRSVVTEKMSKEAIRITCRERIRLRDCQNITEEECEKLLEERFKKECLERLPAEISIEEVPVKIDINNETKSISIQIGNLTLRTRHRLHIMEKKLFIETPHKNISINVIPSIATQVVMTKEPIDKINNAELDIENETIATYKIEGNRKAKLIGIIPVELKIRARVNAETGDIISVEKPWWSFLTIR